MNALHPKPAKRPATYQDVLDAPPNMVAEIVDGELHLQARPARRHGAATLGLGVELRSRFGRGSGGEGDWVIQVEPELHLGLEVLVPDVAAWRRARLPADEGNDPPWIRVVPDWVCEVLSPSTRRLDLTSKRRLYAEAGVGHLWFVDPVARTLEAFALGSAGWVVVTTLADDDPVRLAPFDAAEWPLASLWAD